MKKLGKKLLSVILVLCIAVSMVVMAIPSAQAVGGAFLKKKALDLGLRFACAAATQLAAQCENDDASIVVDSVIKFIIQDAHGAATSEIKEMCKEILEELAVINENITEYSSEISSAIGKLAEEEMRKSFENKWGSDVSDIVSEYRLNDILNTYTKYLIVSTLYSSGKPDDATFAAIEAYWETLTDAELSFSYQDCQAYKQDFVMELVRHVTIETEYDDAEVYGNAQIFADIDNAISELIAKFVYDDVANHSEQYSVMDCAATEAYYALPFSSQQYEYIVAQGKRQVMVATLLEMALNEFLALQGEYLVNNNLQDTELVYYYNYNKKTITYDGCKTSYQTITDNVLEETCKLFESNIRVNCKPYTGQASYECSLEDYMKPEDAVATKLTINGFESSHTYTKEKQETELWHLYAWSNMNSKASSTAKETEFIRVMPGGISGEVYYILDASQYSNATYLDFTKLKHRVKREYVTDGGVGDLHIVSCDYYNFIKQMTDGVNTYSLPNNDNINAELGALIDVPSYGANSSFVLSDFLAPFAPVNIWNGGCSDDLRILTSTYDNNLTTGAATAVKKADITVVNANSKGANTGEFTTEEVQLNDKLGSGVYSYLAILSSDSDEPYKQNVSIKYDDPYNAFEQRSTYIVSENYDDLNYNETAAYEPGTKLTINFWIDNPGDFESLKMVRKNSEDSETVLIQGYEELAYYNTGAGSGSGYSIDVTMPYSEVEFLFTSRENTFPTAEIKTIDPADTVYACRIDYYGNSQLPMGEAHHIAPGSEIEILFAVSNVSTFKGVGAYDPVTQEITVLATAEDLASLDTVGNYYRCYATMPDTDVEYYIVTNEPEEFIPEELEIDEEGTFLIGSYEELRSAAHFINTGEEKYTDGNYKVTNDINCMNLGLERLADSYEHLFTGTFDGQGYTISNYKIYAPEYDASLFGEVDGEIKNLTLAGVCTASNTGSKSYVYFEGLAERIRENAVITNVNTNLTFKIENFDRCGGVFGLAASTYGGVIEKCLVNSTADFPDDKIVYCGVTGGFSGSYHSVIRNCGAICNLNAADDSNIYGLARVSMNTPAEFVDCYAGGAVSGGDVCPMVASNISVNVTMTNCYYLEDLLTSASATTYPTMGTSMTKAQFESGEVAYLLNSGVTDGTQVWYQNIDNGKPHDTYPFFEGGTVYVSAGTCVSAGKGYTNIPGEITHNYNNYHVCKDCIGLRPGEAAGIYGFSIGLGGNISVNYYTVIDEEVANDPTAKMIFTVPDTGNSYNVEIPVSEATFDGTFHHFTCEVAAKEITSDIFCQVVSDTRASDVFRYSVKEYAEVILANPDVYADEGPLVKSMLNYGAYAQIYFNHNTQNLANTSEYISEDEKVLVDELDLSDYEFALSGTQDGVAYYGSSLSLKSETAIIHYFTIADGVDVNSLDVTVNGKASELVLNGNLYMLKISDIPAHKLDEMYEVKVGDLILDYGVFSYGYKAMNKTNENLKNAVKALYAYNQAAIEYIA